MIHTFAPINPAQPRFENGSLRADQFKDGYFGSSRALDESRHVYLQGNRLAERFHSNYQFTVGELGFGTGVNFLLTYESLLPAHLKIRLSVATRAQTVTL